MLVRVGHIGSGSPVGLLVASQHGDEGPWGTRAIRKFLETTPLTDLRGSHRVVPVANPMAFDENMRESHIDRNDLNMEFPGDPSARIRNVWRTCCGSTRSMVRISCSTFTAAEAGVWIRSSIASPGSHEVARRSSVKAPRVERRA